MLVKSVVLKFRSNTDVSTSKKLSRAFTPGSLHTDSFPTGDVKDKMGLDRGAATISHFYGYYAKPVAQDVVPIDLYE